jgi:hypothetical protein
MAGQISGTYVAVTAVGAVLVWSGWKGTTLTATFKSLLAGNLNAPVTETAAAAAGYAGATDATSAPSVTGNFTLADLEQLWTAEGGDQATAFTAAQVALAESSGRPAVTSPNPDGGTNVGLWQLDTPGGVGAGYTVEELQNPETNAHITILATANGTNWSQWADAVVVNGKYVGPTS